jgi:PKD repeat protein
MARHVVKPLATALAAMLLIWLLFSGKAPAQGRNPSPEAPGIDLPVSARGAAALGALAPYLPQIAALHGKSPDELRAIFLRDQTIWADQGGRLLYGCEFGQPPAAPRGGVQAPVGVAAAPYPDDQTFLLHSRPGATKVIYLDFDGHVTSGTAWNSNFNGGQDIVSAPYDADGIPSSFSSAERANIQYMWQRVAEDFAPFDVDVTTQDPGVEGLRKTSSSDSSYGIRVVISPTNWYSTNAGGVAYLGSFNWNSDTPCYAFTQQLANGEKYIAEAASHEAGHTVGLHHDGVTGGSAYYAGHGTWAPIMGVGYYKDVTQWSKGEYSGANNTEDDLAIIPTYGVPLRADDHGNFIGSATPLAGPNVSASGIIETRNDADMFSFQTGAGSVSFTVNPGPRGPNLDILVSLYNATGGLIASNNGTGLPASLTATVAAGTYYLSIDGVGTGDPTTGYSDYASLGQYQITGTIVSTGNQSPIATASATPSSGSTPLPVNFSSAGSYDPDGTIQGYYWDFGDGGSSTLANPAHTYASAGSYTATLVVTDNGGLSASKTVAITATPPPNQTPIAHAAASPASGTAPLAVTFSSAGSYDPDGSIQSYGWTFGDGGTSTASSPSHTYSAAGTFTAVLTVTDNQGATGTSSVAVSVQPDPNKVVFVTDIAMTLVSSPAGTSARATITIKDATGAVRPGATVSGTWSGRVTGNATGTTDATGKVSFTSKKTKQQGTFVFTVTGVSLSGYTYDPTRNVETSDSIASP